jgi:hypothetical protein
VRGNSPALFGEGAMEKDCKAPRQRSTPLGGGPMEKGSNAPRQRPTRLSNPDPSICADVLHSAVPRSSGMLVPPTSACVVRSAPYQLRQDHGIWMPLTVGKHERRRSAPLTATLSHCQRYTSAQGSGTLSERGVPAHLSGQRACRVQPALPQGPASAVYVPSPCRLA